MCNIILDVIDMRKLPISGFKHGTVIDYVSVNDKSQLKT